MKLHHLQHVPFEGLGCIADWAEQHGHEISCSRLYADDPLPEIDELDFLVIMGGPMGVYDESQYPWLVEEKRFIESVLKTEKPVLGICLGSQLLADVLGAKIFPGTHKELGWLPIERVAQAEQTAIGKIIPEKVEVFHWHGDQYDLPQGAVRLAKSAACENQSFIVDERILGFLFHFEMTLDAAKILIENCSDEIIDAPYIQDPQEMVAEPSKFERINSLMGNCLDKLTAGN